MSKVKPLSPEEVTKQKISNIPDMMIEAVNQLIVEKWKGKSATVKQDDIVARFLQLTHHVASEAARLEVYENNWLDFEPIFEEAGWKVVYDKPAYCESYDATFEFTKKT